MLGKDNGLLRCARKDSVNQELMAGIRIRL